MPASKKKMKKTKMKKAKKVTLRRRSGQVLKKKTKSMKKNVKKSMSKKPVAKRKMVMMVKKAKEKAIGKVIHYYDRIGVAIVDLKSPLNVGDTVILKRGDAELLKQKIVSMQIEHMGIMKAKKGDVVGLKVEKPVPEGTLVLPM